MTELASLYSHFLLPWEMAAQSGSRAHTVHKEHVIPPAFLTSYGPHCQYWKDLSIQGHLGPEA